MALIPKIPYTNQSANDCIEYISDKIFKVEIISPFRDKLHDLIKNKLSESNWELQVISKTTSYNNSRDGVGGVSCTEITFKVKPVVS